jgi:hypothetical protein
MRSRQPAGRCPTRQRWTGARDEVLDEIDALLRAGLLDGIPSRGDDRLLAVRELALTARGAEELRRLRRTRPRQPAPAALAGSDGSVAPRSCTRYTSW